MQRNYEINANKREPGEDKTEGKLRSVSVYLGKKHLRILESVEDSSRSETLRRLIEWFDRRKTASTDITTDKQVKKSD